MAQSETQFPAHTKVETSERVSLAVAVAAGLYAVVGGAISLAGWVLDIRRLTDWRDDNISMFANTALCAVMGGAALLMLIGQRDVPWRRVAARLLAGAVALLGALTIFELITGINLGIDTMLANRPWGQRASTAPMRMGPPASMSFLMLGAGLLLATYGREARRIASGFAMSVVAISSLSLIGYWFGADELFGVARLTAIAWQSSTMLFALSIGLMAAMPDRGIVSALRRDDAGGTVLRRLIVPIVGIPLLLGWLRVMGQHAGYYDMSFGTAIRSLAEIVLLVWLLWWTANGISLHAQAARQAEQALRESEQRYREIAAEAKDADRRKDEFLATLAHELRNPLAPIGNSLALIKHAGDDKQIQQQARDTMERQFGQMVRLVDDLLDIGRITRDKLELRTQPVELASVVHQAVETCRSLAQGMRHELRLSLPTEPIWLDADPVRLAQVLINLLNNAYKFSEPGSQISLSVERQANEVTISVRDSGIGIAPDKLERIFEMFEQVDKSLERNRGGLGIGLTLVRRLVELHGGRITVRSDGPGQGSEFVVHLPVAANTDGPVTAPKLATVSPQRRRILVTDDNRHAAKTLALILRHDGHEVETAYDGRQAIERAEAWRPDLMLLDLGMPEMNGYDVCRSIRQQPWGKDIRIVALTGWGQEQDRRNTREAGFDDHLVKPVDAATLGKVVAGNSSRA